mmetsp:Transcript_19830/g.35263  ORF Transcript_19830/g.35263 Transcript_19830/m.35263 type:complete len:240 (+) Transcript_19830:48-767(+)
MSPRLRSLVCADTSGAWSKAGFSLGCDGASNMLSIGALRIVLSGASQPSAASKAAFGFTSWVWEGLGEEYGAGKKEIGGVPTEVVEPTAAPKRVEHRNGLTGVDHVVLRTRNLEGVRASLEEAGISRRAERSDLYPGITQEFYRPFNEMTIEVVGPTPGTEPSEIGGFLGNFTEGPETFLWGITFVTEDMEKTKAFFGEKMSKVKPAAQPGRLIGTIRGKKVGLSPAIAVLTPYKSASL